jgi:hemerythrin
MQALMKAANFGEYASHKSAHDEFLATLNGASTPVSDDSIVFFKNWSVIAARL